MNTLLQTADKVNVGGLFFAKNFKNQVKYGIIKAWKTV